MYKMSRETGFLLQDSVKYNLRLDVCRCFGKLDRFIVENIVLEWSKMV
jgi:hypothetical protein